MIATAPPTVVNRIAGYVSSPPPPVPATPERKQAAWGEALFAAAMLYQSRLAHPDPEVAERAARSIFDLEKTRLRHGRELAGTPKPEAPAPPAEGPKLPTQADVERLGKIAELTAEAVDFEVIDDGDELDNEIEENKRHDELRAVRDRVEAFASTEAFRPFVRGAMEFLKAQGQKCTAVDAIVFAKLQLFDQLIGRQPTEANEKGMP
jgi:hypothetical protein